MRRRAAVFMVLGALVLAVAVAEPLYPRLFDRPIMATAVTGTVSAISADGRSVCLTVDDDVECAVPRWSGDQDLAAVGQVVRAYYVDVPTGPAGDAMTERVWVAFYPSQVVLAARAGEPSFVNDV